MLLQIMFLYLAVPTVVRSITGQRFQADPYVCGLIAMSLNSGAYQVELIRSGILGVDKGQWEACRNNWFKLCSDYALCYFTTGI